MEASSLSPPNLAERSRRARLERRIAAVHDGGRMLFGTVALSWAIGIFLVIELVRAGGFWQVAANTRILDVFVRAGIVRLTDTGVGLIGTAPDVRYYVQANDYIKRFLVVFEAVAFAVYAAAALGYTQWLAELSLPLGILAGACFLARAVRGSADGPPTLRDRARTATRTVQAFDQDRVMFVKLAVVSIASFGGTCLSFSL